MTRETLDAFIREVLAKTARDKTPVKNDAQEAYADEMRRWNWRP